MGTAITIALVVAVGAIVAFGVALAVRGKREYDTANEIVPGVPSNAPDSWAGSHSPEAKLHRRLRDAVAALRANPNVAEYGLTDSTASLEREALAIDERLIAAAALPERTRDDPVAAFEPLVAGLEDAVTDLVTSVQIADSRELVERAVSDADLRLQALAEARAEVERIDRRQSGQLDDPPPASAP
ncbi:MAG: hypothetical protein AAFY28_16805 [Actinomycetota bacterium]